MNDPHWAENGHTASEPKEWTGEVGLLWKKCPSVTTGGKQYFYTALSEHKQRVWVVWDRIQQCWIIQDECPNLNNKIITLKDGYKTAKKAMAECNKNIKGG